MRVLAQNCPPGLLQFIAAGVRINLRQRSLTHGPEGEWMKAACLESRASAAIVPANSISQLRYSGSFAPFQPWDGRDAKFVGPAMCGHWLGDTGWVNAENSSC